MAMNIITAWKDSMMKRVARRPILSERTPATTRPPALPIAMMATATKAIGPMLFLASPATLPITISPAPEPMKKATQRT